MGALTEEELRTALAARRGGGDLAGGVQGALLARRRRSSAGRRAVHVKLDSGMGRLGERDPVTLIELAARLRRG